jgi:hypothetical protein
MTVRELLDQLKKRHGALLSGARALAERLAEKKKAGQLSPGEEEDWHDAIFTNVKAAEEVQQDIDALGTLLG